MANGKSEKEREKVKKFVGVYYRESTVKRHNGKPDRCFDINFKDQYGKLIWEKVGWASEGYSAELASQIRANRVMAIRHGNELPTKKKKPLTFGDLWTKYNEWLEHGKARPRDDRLLYKNHLQEKFERTPIDKITPLDLEGLKKELAEKGLSQASVKHCLVLVRQVINKAVTWGLWCGENPIDKVKMPKLSNRRERFLSSDEAQRLLAALEVRSHTWFSIALMSLHTGMRAGEIFALKWGHVNIEEGIIHVADPKNEEPRKAFMTGTLKGILSELKPGRHDDYVFRSVRGERITAISDTYPKVVEALGFNDGVTDPRQKVTFHTLRHTFASWLALEGTPILTIKELLGHKSLAMTERYSHLIPDHKREAIGAIDRKFFRNQSSELD